MSQNVKINIVPGAIGPAIHLSQYDVGREFVIEVVDSDGSFSIPTGATADLVGTKPSGFGFTLAGTVSGNTVTFTSTDAITAEYGRIPCEVSIAKSGDVLGTCNLVLDVEQSPHPEGTTDGQSESAIPVLTALVERVEEAASSIHDLTVEAETLAYNASATATFDDETDTLTIGVPRGGALSVTDPNSDGNIIITFQ